MEVLGENMYLFSSKLNPSENVVSFPKANKYLVVFVFQKIKAQDVQERSWRGCRSQVPHVPRLPRGRGDELRRQHWGQESVRDCRLRHPGQTQQAATRVQWRHGSCDSQKGNYRICFILDTFNGLKGDYDSFKLYQILKKH